MFPFLLFSALFDVTRRDLHLQNAKFGFIKFSTVYLIFLVKGEGAKLRSALQLSKRMQAQGEHSEAKELPFSFLWERRFYLRSVCSYERSEVERRPFLSQALSNPTARYKLLRYAQV